MLKLIVVMLVLVLGGVLTAQNYSFVDPLSKKELTPSVLAQKLKKYDIVFFGEYHDNADIHTAQLDLLKEMFKAKKRLTLSFEMFERDVQPVLDSYLQSIITEQVFLEGSRPWPNYDSDYKPLIEFAKTNKLSCIAANVPRRLAGKAARNGVAYRESFTSEEDDWVAKEVTNPPGKYRDNFFQTMAANGMHGSGADTELLNNLFLAQCIKDDTMAESIVTYRKTNPKYQIIHYNGDFHSREFLGTVERCLWRAPKLKIAVISPQYQSSPLPDDASSVATYFIVIPDHQLDDSLQEGTP